MRAWEEYLSELMGERVKAVPDVSAGRHLSIGMTAVYDVYSGQLLDKAVRFIVPKKSAGPALPDLLRHYSALRKNLDSELVFVLPSAKPYEAKRLIMERIPFVVPGRQVFLPRHVVLVQSSAPVGGERVDSEDSLSPRAQALLLFHLQKEPLAGHTQVQIAGVLHWTPMTVSRAVQELQQKRLCQTLSGGRANTLSMDRGRDLWERAESWLTSPVRTRRYARLAPSPAELRRHTSLETSSVALRAMEDKTPRHARLQKTNGKAALYDAGMTALSRYTMINEDPVPVLAIHERAFSALLQAGGITVCPYRDEGCVQVELWRYDPVLLAEDKAVDRLSLYLSLKGHPDERVEGALRDLLKEMPWQG